MTTENTPSQQIDRLQKAINERADIKTEQFIRSVSVGDLLDTYGYFDLKLKGGSIERIAFGDISKNIMSELRKRYRQRFIDEETKKFIDEVAKLRKDVDNLSERVDGLPQ